LIRAILLPGAVDGMLYFITPDISKIWNLKVGVLKISNYNYSAKIAYIF